MQEIIARVRGWAATEAQASDWYRTQAIPALGEQTPEALVEAGQAKAVHDYLDLISLGGFA